LLILGGRVAKRTRLQRYIEVTGSHSSFGDISEINVSNRYSLQHRRT